MNCKNAQSLLSAYLDEELTGREMLDLRAHLGQCAQCSEELKCVQAVRRLLGGSPVPEPSADFEDRLVSSVLAATDLRPAAKKLSLMTLTGIAAVSMLATMMLLNSMKHEPSAVADQNQDLPFELIQQDRAFGASTSPFTASPVVSRNFEGR
jgi:anti-sigma factor RsiW